MRIVHSPKGATSWLLWVRHCDRCWKCTIQVEETEKKKVDNFNRVWWLRIQSPLTISPLIQATSDHFCPWLLSLSPNRALLLCLSHVMDWILVSPHPLMAILNPYPWFDGNRRWGVGLVIRMRWGHEGGAPSMGLVSLDEFPEHSLPPSALWVRRQHNANWKRALIRAQPCWHPQLTLPVEWWEINVCCL